jgi:hypothetical protein
MRKANQAPPTLNRVIHRVWWIVAEKVLRIFSGTSFHPGSDVLARHPGAGAGRHNRELARAAGNDALLLFQSQSVRYHPSAARGLDKLHRRATPASQQ